MPSVTRTIHFEKTQERYELTASPACVHLDGGGNQTETVTVRLMHYKGKESDEITGKYVTITDGANSANFTLPAEINQSGSTVISQSLDDREHGAPDSLTVIGILGANNLVIPVVHDGADGENAVTVQTSPEAILHKKATTSSQYSLAIRVWNGKTAVPAPGFSAKIQSKPNGLSKYMIASATDSYIKNLGISINANTEINGDITIAVTYNGNTYTKVVPFKTVVNGDPGIKGEKGASLRGPQAWSDLSVGYQFYQGKDGEEYKDIVLYNGNFYSCIKTHVKSATNYPGGTEDTSNGYWKVSENFELIATKVFFAKLAQIDNLEIGDHINIKDKNGVIVLVANKDGLTCKQGTFENVTIAGYMYKKKTIITKNNVSEYITTDIFSDSWLDILKSGTWVEFSDLSLNLSILMPSIYPDVTTYTEEQKRVVRSMIGNTILLQNTSSKTVGITGQLKSAENLGGVSVAINQNEFISLECKATVTNDYEDIYWLYRKGKIR